MRQAAEVGVAQVFGSKHKTDRRLIVLGCMSLTCNVGFIQVPPVFVPPHHWVLR